MKNLDVRNFITNQVRSNWATTAIHFTVTENGEDVDYPVWRFNVKYIDLSIGKNVLQDRFIKALVDNKYDLDNIEIREIEIVHRADTLDQLYEILEGI